jgi:hypothetical protein
LRSAEIQFHVTGAHARVFRRLGVPVTWHRVAVCIELRLDVGKIFNGLTSGVVLLQTRAAASGH